MIKVSLRLLDESVHRFKCFLFRYDIEFDKKYFTFRVLNVSVVDLLFSYFKVFQILIIRYDCRRFLDFLKVFSLLFNFLYNY